jgi:mRNA interferase MazF
MTTKIRKWPTRVLVNFSGKEGQVVLEQIKSVDKSRLKKKLGHLPEFSAHQVLQRLREMFS